MERNWLRARSLTLALALGACALRVSPAGDASAGADATPDAAAECASGDDCDDGVACTVERCVAGRCERTTLDARCAEDERCDPRAGCVDPRCEVGRRACPMPGGALRCVDPRRDVAHCGGCERPCALGEACVDGACRRSPGDVGARCVDSTQCAPGLTCDDSRNGLCTRACEDLGDDDLGEAVSCGGEGRRCVRGDEGPACGLGCDPLARPRTPGACPVGEVCTGAWWLDPNYLPDAPGCVPWCSADADCAESARGPRCNPRLGRCASVGEDRALAADGAPCDPRALQRVEGDARPRSAVCRGFCVQTGADPARGVCASFVDRSRFARCPDDGQVVSLRGPFGADNLALCMWRRCAGDCECAGALRCLLPESDGRPLPGEPRFCAWPTAAQPTGAPCR